MRRSYVLALASMLALGIVVSVAGVSCDRAERVAPPPLADPPALQASGDEGDGSEGEVTFVGLADELMADSVGLLPDTLLTLGDDDAEAPGPPEPDDFILWLQSAYEQRNAQMVAAILADDYVCTEITGCGQRSWGRETAIRIHERMFDSACEVKPIANIGLELDNATVIPPIGGPEDPAATWTLRCEAHLAFLYANPQDGTWSFVGPAEFVIRANPDSPCGWELVAWHDQLPHSAE